MLINSTVLSVVERLRSWDRTEARDIYRLLKWLKARKVLELGCGPGLLARYLIDRGFQVVGVDLDCNLAKRLGIECHECDLNEFERCEVLYDEYDVVVSQHVLEHLKQDKVRELINWLWMRRIRQIHLVPGHRGYVSSHVVDGYFVQDLDDLFKEVPHIVVPDSRCRWDPRHCDWIVIVGVTKLPRWEILRNKLIKFISSV